MFFLIEVRFLFLTKEPFEKAVFQDTFYSSAQFTTVQRMMSLVNSNLFCQLKDLKKITTSPKMPGVKSLQFTLSGEVPQKYHSLLSSADALGTLTPEDEGHEKSVLGSTPGATIQNFHHWFDALLKKFNVSFQTYPEELTSKWST